MELKNKKVLVTGGAGFIGSHLVNRLIEDGCEVSIIDNLSTGKKENLNPNATFIQNSITNYNVVDSAVKGVDTIFHFAALASVIRSVEKPIPSNENNISGTLNLLEAARKNDVRRFILSSSSSIYGEHPDMPRTETQTPMPISPYALQKITCEKYCKLYYDLYGLESISLRYFNVFGPRQDPFSEYSAVIPKFITALLNGKQPTIYGDGSISRDFTYVENNVNANILGAKASKSACGESYNVASGGSITILELAKKIGELLGKPANPNFAEPRPGDPKASEGDCSKAKEKLGFEITVPFEEGLIKTIEYYKNENP